MRSKTVFKMINVFIVVLLLFTGIMNGSTSRVLAQTGDVYATAVPSAGSLNVGEQVTVSIQIDMSDVDPPDNALGSFTSTLSWDPTILSYYENSGLLEGFTGAINTGSVGSGLITFNGANSSGATGGMQVLIITFDVILPGTTALDLEFSAMSAAGSFNSLLGILNTVSYTHLTLPTN